MEFKLVRDFNYKKDKEQELQFIESANLELFFSLEKTLFGVDDWSFANIKKLAKQELPCKVTLTFQKWNANIDYLYYQLNLYHTFYFKAVSSEVKKCIMDKDGTYFNVLIKTLNDQQKIETCFYLLTLLGNDLKTFELVNKAMNTRFVNFNKILNLLFFKYTIGRKN